MAVTPSSVAAIVSTYVPPFLGVPTGTTAASAPTASPTGTDPTIPPITDGKAWITAYLLMHRLSAASFRYAYLMWIVILFFGLLFALLHWTGFRGGFIGASFDKWAYRRRTWRKKHALKAAPHRQPTALPSNAQLLSLLILLVGPILLSFIGPDYIRPDIPLWDLTNTLSIARRDTSSTAVMTPPQITIDKTWWTSSNRMGLIAFALFPLSVLLALKAPPFALFALPVLTSLHFDKLTRLHKWCGRIVYLLTVGHVATWAVQLAKDRQTGVSDRPAISFVLLYEDFLFAVTAFICFTLLIIFSIGPIRDRYYETFRYLHILLVPATLVFSALHFPPLGAWCYVALGLWVAERIYRYCRQFWVNGAFGTKKVNGPLANERSLPPTPYAPGKEWQASTKPNITVRFSQFTHNEKPLPLPTPTEEPPHSYPPIKIRRKSVDDSFTEFISEYYQYDGSSTDVTKPSSIIADRQYSIDHSPASSLDLIATPHPGVGGVPPEYSNTYSKELPTRERPISPTGGYVPTPPGFAHAIALPGRTVLLTLQTSRPLTWAPGQHVLLRVPALSKLTMHPFTIASCCDKEERSELVLLIRAKKGFTLQLWRHIYQRSGPSRTVAETLFTPSGRPKRGILMHATVDGPYGSAERARWGDASTVVIIVGGSGVSFGTAILEYLCLCLKGKDGKTLGGRTTKGGKLKTDRIRFVWTVREYSHLQWSASIIRRCLDMMPRHLLQIDIFVTNGMKYPISQVSSDARSMAYQSQVFEDDATLAPPVAQFARTGRPRTMSNASNGSADSGVSDNEVTDLNYASDEGGRLPRKLVAVNPDEEEEPHILDMTNFDDEDDTRMPGEDLLSQKVRKEGKVRRAISRRFTGSTIARDLRHIPRDSEPSMLPYANSPTASTMKGAPGSMYSVPAGLPHANSPTTPTMRGAHGSMYSVPAVPSHASSPTTPTVKGAPGSVRIGSVAPPISCRSSAEQPASPSSFYPPGHPGRRSDVTAPPYDDTTPRQTVFSSADMYVESVDPLSFAPPPPFRPPRAQRTALNTSVDQRPRPPHLAGLMAPEGYQYDSPITPSPANPHQYNAAHEQPPTHKKRESKSSVYTTGSQASSLYSQDPAYDTRSIGGAESVRSLVDRNSQLVVPKHQRTASKIDMDDWELDDLNVVSEMARPGRPKLDRILADEVERANGELTVACCGPATLNAMVRKVVAAQINPSRLMRGDKRGRITLVTEDFEW
ncbi:hypothetical protein DACRYDRAFT_20041 [Dacryopinax primogenitus]|uniref:ferric-chelate reductase (NADPH) n=1 Tax=Dacryopinax primogenitus (strain DJM 731) TaxID=1858805 RepID=M5GB33_DACPD|nr:uncharacterized protein DACRYDRAFT_20041 [Dacryopinax primogenitus]EJU05605.1 hypothetical protein DACRYDRAFT_20041 [Dacryopinax primogenitus]